MSRGGIEEKALPEGWREVRLNDVASIKTGPFGAQLHQHDYVKCNGTPIVTVEHLGERGLTHNNLPLVSNHDKKRLSKYLIQEGDIVFSRVGSVDRSALVSKEESGWLFSGRLLRVSPNKHYVHSSYLNYFFHARKFRHHMRSIAVGGTMPSINTSILSGVTIFLPSMEEQKTIASLLETWDTAIEKTEALIVAKEKRFKWLLCRLFADNEKWNKTYLDNLVKVKKGQQLNRIDLEDTGNYPAWNGGVTPSGYTDNWNTPENTVTISEGGNSCEFVNYCKQKFWCGGHCYALINVSEQIDCEFLYYFLKGNEKHIMRLRVGSGLPNIQKTNIGKFEIKYPDRKEQKTIAHTLNTVQNEIILTEQLAERYRKQKRGLMQKLLIGKWNLK